MNLKKENYNLIMKGEFPAIVIPLDGDSRIKERYSTDRFIGEDVRISWKAYARNGTEKYREHGYCRLLMIKYRIRPIMYKIYNRLANYYESIGIFELREEFAERLKVMDIQMIESVCHILSRQIDKRYYNSFFHRNALIPFSRYDVDIQRETLKMQAWEIIRDDPEFRMDLLLMEKDRMQRRNMGKHEYIQSEIERTWQECEHIKEEMED